MHKKKWRDDPIVFIIRSLLVLESWGTFGGELGENWGRCGGASRVCLCMAHNGMAAKSKGREGERWILTGKGR